MKKIMTITVLSFLLILSGCIWSNTSETEFEYRVLPGNDTVNLGETWDDPGALFEIDGETHEVFSDETVDSDQTGIYKIHYEYTDEDETYEAYRKVAVVDNGLPELKLKPGQDTIIQDSSWEDAGVDFDKDRYDEDNLRVEGSVDTSTPGDYQVEYIYENDYGNEASVVRIVSVIED